jgi:fibronectin type 3 domain-containing protein
MEEGCPEPMQIPSAPSNLQATQMSCTSTKLTWTDSSSYTERFYVYRKCGDGEYELIADTFWDFFNDTNVPPGVTCTYYVTAYNSAGQSQPSNEAIAGGLF